MKIFRKFLACFLSVMMVVTALPLTAMADTGASNVYTMTNDYIKVQVSAKNGGFTVNTVEGDLIKKSDNNKRLLFHDDEYDTSFISYRVEYADGKTEDYIFGGKYGGLTDASRKGVSVTQAQANGDIVATWGTGDLTFTQTITLANDSSNEFGMVSVQLAVKNAGSSQVKVKARILLDTYLGDKDYGYYQVLDENSVTNLVTTEQVIDGSATTMPQNFYAVDNVSNPGIVAYSVSDPSKLPYQVAFGHWNNLASSLFDFTPNDPAIDFTKDQNDYLTTDSAYALYYDMGAVATSGNTSLVSYYGVYSNSTVAVDQSVSINATAPLRLNLNADKTAFERLDTTGEADFKVSVSYTNLDVKGAKAYDNLKLVVQSTTNLRSLGDSGQIDATQDYETIDPFIAESPTNVPVGKTINKELYFKARLTDEASYERITISVYDVSGGSSDLVEDKRLGTKEIYVLLPGSDGNIPKVAFTSMTPDTIYFEGTRHLFVTVTNPTMLDNPANWNLYAYPKSTEEQSKDQRIEIPHANISMNNDVLDVILDETMETPTGAWYLQLEWTDAAVTNKIVTEKSSQSSGQLEFYVSKDTKYKNDTYGILAIVKHDFPGSKGSEYIIKSFMDEDSYKKYVEEDKQVTTYASSVLIEFRGAFEKNEYRLDSKNEKVGTYYTAVSTKDLNQGTREYETTNAVTINGCMDFEGGTISVYYEDYDKENLSDCMDSAVCVEFDGELLTSDARTSIWSGNAAFTKLEQGGDYALRPYDKDGNRKDFAEESICLVWPSVFGVAQTISGMIFKMAYAELGVMYYTDGTELGRVVSFTAQFQLDIDLRDTGAYGEKTTSYMSKLKDIWKYYRTGDSVYQYTYNDGKNNRAFEFDEVNEEQAMEDESTFAVMVQDVLFGCGEGLVGVHFKVGVGLTNVIIGCAELEGFLEVNTVHDWSFGFEGAMQLVKTKVDVKLSFKSHNDVPVPDDIYFYVSGFKPGLNVDGCGVVWLTGGGGGISDIYDTIYCSGTPPLKLILKVSFNLLQVLNATATLSVSASSLNLSATKIKIFDEIPVMDALSFGLTWLPSMDLRAAFDIYLFQGIINGNGYAVLNADSSFKKWFFEMYARATLNLPESIPALAGMEIGGVSLGLNSEKIWGAANVLALELGVTYYWGDSSVDFFTGGSTKVQPTYPDLLDLAGVNENGDVPVYYDEENDRILYAHVGTNLSEGVEAVALSADGSEIESAEADGLKLMDEEAPHPELNTSVDYTLHKFNLGEYYTSRIEETYTTTGIALAEASNCATLVQVEYDAESIADARAKAKSFKIGSSYDSATKTVGGDSLPLKFYEDGTKLENGSAAANELNANVSWNSATKKAVFTISITDSKHFAKDWYLSSGNVSTNVTYYNVNSLPKMTSLSIAKASDDEVTKATTSQTGAVSASDEMVTVSFDGTKIDEIDEVKFYLTSSNDPAKSTDDPGYELCDIKMSELYDTAETSDGFTVTGYETNATTGMPVPAKLTGALPEGLPSGEYYVRAVYSKTDEMNSEFFSTSKFSYTNSKTPESLTASDIIGFEPAGDLTLGLTVNDKNLTDSANTDGYVATVYDADGNQVDSASGMIFERTAGTNTYIQIGGSYNSVTDASDDDIASLNDDTVTIETAGLEAGKSYSIGIKPYNLLDSDGDGENDGIIYGSEIMTGSKVLPAKTTPNVSITANKSGQSVAGKSAVKDANGNVDADDAIPTFASDELTFTAKAAGGEALTGSWTLDGAAVSDTDVDGTSLSDSKYGYYGEFSGLKSVSIPLKQLTDGRHKLTLTGKDADGDGFRVDYVFAVDTEAPRLMVKSPVNGTPTDADGGLEITGVTDEDALISVVAGSTTLVDKKTISQISGAAIDNEGSFSLKVNIPWSKTWLEKDVTITAEDVLGNKTSITATVASGAVRDMQSVLVKVDDAVDSDGNIEGSTTTALTKKLSLVGLNSAGEEFALDSNYVIWDCTAVDGTASVTSDGTLTIGAGAQGIVTGKYEVSKGAYMTYTLCFGAEITNNFVYTGGEHGSVLGNGYYRKGETVTLAATADSGYSFAGWKVVSGLKNDASSLSSKTDAITSFTMPNENVVLQAEYTWTGLPQETTPIAQFTATGENSGRLTNVESGMQYSLDGGDTWIDITDTSVEISDIAASQVIKVKKPGNGTTTSDSEPQTITVTKAAAPQSPKAESCTTDKNNDGKITGVSTGMQYKSASDTTWKDCTGDTVEGLVPGDYQVRTKAAGGALASDAVSVTIEKYIPSSSGGSSSSSKPAVTQTDSLDIDKGDLVTVDPSTGKATKKTAFGSDEASAIGKDSEKLKVKSGDIPYYYDEDGQVTFVPFSAEKDGKIIFIAPKDGKYYFTENNVSFNDMTGHWAEGEVDFTAAREIFNGIGDDKFEPGDSMTRAMFVTVLWRMAGKPSVTDTSKVKSFTDVDDSSWYAQAVSWASANGIVNGISDTAFAPDDLVTREQMCALLSRFLDYEQIKLNPTNEAASFTDNAQISSWAADDVKFCQQAGLITGYPDGSFNPKGKASRAENAAVFERMVETVIDQAK